MSFLFVVLVAAYSAPKWNSYTFAPQFVEASVDRPDDSFCRQLAKNTDPGNLL
jgi:hypothetical protein